MAVRKVNVRDVPSEPFIGRDVRALIGAGTPIPARELSMVVTTIPAGGIQRPVHAHMGFDEVIYVTQGQGVIWVDEETAPINPGDAILIPAGAKHTLKNTSDRALILVCAFSSPNFKAKRENYEGINPFEEGLK